MIPAGAPRPGPFGMRQFSNVTETLADARIPSASQSSWTVMPGVSRGTIA